MYTNLKQWRFFLEISACVYVSDNHYEQGKLEIFFRIWGRKRKFFKTLEVKIKYY